MQGKENIHYIMHGVKGETCKGARGPTQKNEHSLESFASNEGINRRRRECFVDVGCARARPLKLHEKEWWKNGRRFDGKS